MFINQFPTIHQNIQTRGTSLKPINVLIATGDITKTGTLVTTLHKPAGESNLYVRFGYVPLTISNHN